MNKKNLIIGIVVLVALVGGVVLYIASQSQKNTEVKRNNAEKTQGNVKEVVKQTQGQKTVQKQKTTNQQTTDQNKTIEGEKTKFGIDDSQLKYNEDGSIDTSEWKTFKYLGKEYLLPLGWGVIYENGPYGMTVITNRRPGGDTITGGEIRIELTSAPLNFTKDTGLEKKIEEAIHNDEKEVLEGCDYVYNNDNKKPSCINRENIKCLKLKIIKLDDGWYGQEKCNYISHENGQKVFNYRSALFYGSRAYKNNNDVVGYFIKGISSNYNTLNANDKIMDYIKMQVENKIFNK